MQKLLMMFFKEKKRFCLENSKKSNNCKVELSWFSYDRQDRNDLKKFATSDRCVQMETFCSVYRQSFHGQLLLPWGQKISISAIAIILPSRNFLRKPIEHDFQRPWPLFRLIFLRHLFPPILKFDFASRV